LIARRTVGPERRRARRIAELVLFYIGATAACGVLVSSFPWPSVAVAAAVATVLRLLVDTRRSAVVRAAALTVLAALYAAWAYFAVVFGYLLAWTVPWPIRLTLVLLAVLAAVGWQRPGVAVRVPAVLPLGLWIAICALGWWREDGVIRCDDYARFRTDASVSLAVPTTRALASCAPGEVLRLRRYPRRVWESPDQSRYIVPTQEGINRFPHGTPVSDPIEDGVCEFGADGTRHACVGGSVYKMQVIFDSAPLDRVFVGGWGPGHGVLYTLPRSDHLRLLGEAYTDVNTGEGFYDPDADEIGLLADQCSGLTRFRASDLSQQPSEPAPFCPGESHYDPIRHEGIFCFAPGPLAPLIDVSKAGYLSVAFRGDPFSFRLLGTSPWHVWTYGALVWGCDFDPANRVAWAPIASLPIIAVLDYDSGRILQTWWAEPGTRSVAFDAVRRRLYMSNFLRGDVIGVDVDSGREVDRWFVGRFARYVALARDGHSLLATSNLGVVRIALPMPSATAHILQPSGTAATQ
jgi:hypothetical protein